MNDYQTQSTQLKEWSELDCDVVDLDDLERKLEAELEEQIADLEVLENDQEKIGNPNTLGETIKDVIWEQISLQIGDVEGKDFIKKNRGLTLDLRDDAHIQTTENFAKGKIASHNTSIDNQERYNQWQSNFQRDENGNIKTTYDNRTGESKQTLRRRDSKKDPQGANYNFNYNARGDFDKDRPKGAGSEDIDHTISAAEIIRDPAANAHLTREEQVNFANSEKNLNPLDKEANISKGDSKMEDWLNSERNGQKPSERFNIDEEKLREKDKEAREEYTKRKEEGEQRSIETGKQSQREEAFRIGGAALRSAIMELLAELIKDIIRKLIAWFRSEKRKFSTFIDSVKDAIQSFVSNIKEHLVNAGKSVLTTIVSAIVGPVIGTLKKAWILLKQGYKSVKEAIDYLKNPANKDKPFSEKMLEIGKIVIVGLVAGGSIQLSEAIEKGLISLIPVFGVEIPLFGSPANMIGLFLGALVSGLIGALALNLIDRIIAKRLKDKNETQQIDKRNEILTTQEKLIEVTKNRVQQTKDISVNHIKERHAEAAEEMKDDIQQILNNSAEIDTPLPEEVEVVEEVEPVSKNHEDLDNLLKDIESI